MYRPFTLHLSFLVLQTYCLICYYGKLWYQVVSFDHFYRFIEQFFGFCTKKKHKLNHFYLFIPMMLEHDVKVLKRVCVTEPAEQYKKKDY